ncbi:MAG: hypothetical protein QW327_01255, partial [Candidatus Odinarchaeota archaeon]
NHILEGYTDFRGWVVSIVDGEKNIQECIQRIEEHSQLTLTVKIFKNSHSISELTPSKYQNTLDTSFERDLINKIESESASSIERVKRVLKSKICGSTVSPIFSSTLLNFEAEEEGLKESLFNSQIFLFVNACKRALYLLTRLDLINEFNIEGVISEKTLLDSIKYNCASASRILDFIYAEWGLSFHKYVKSGKLSVLGDIIEGLWG